MTDIYTDEDGKRYVIVSYGDELPDGFREPTRAEYRLDRWLGWLQVVVMVGVLLAIVWAVVRGFLR